MPTPRLQPSAAFLAQYSGASLIAVAILFTVLDFAFAGLRLVSQKMSKRAFGLDDFFSYFGLIFVIGQSVIGLIMPSQAGVGRHVQYLEIYEPQKLPNEYIIMYPLAISYISAFTFPKLAILFLYLRVFTTKPTRMTTYILIGVVTATWIAETLTAIFRCWPIQYVWDQSIEGHCVNQNAMFQYWSVPNIVTDLAMLVLPLPTVWSLHAPRYQKWALTFTFLLGSLGFVAAIVRFSIFSQVGALDDATWASVPLQQWTIVEPSMYFIAGVLPTLRSVAATSWKKIIGTSLIAKETGVNPTNRHYTKSSGHCQPSTTQKSFPRSDGLELVIQSPSHPASQEDYGGDARIPIPQHVSSVTRGPNLPQDKFERDYDHAILRTQQVTLTHERV